MPQTIREPERDVPVFRTCDVLVAGGGPAGCAAAASAAEMGADTILMERYGHLGGMSTGGLVVWIDRLSDWQGRPVVAGFARDLLERMPDDAVVSPPPDIWGSQDPKLVDYWRRRAAAPHGIVTWCPTLDPEMLKIVSNELLLERGVKLLLHSWAVAPVRDGNAMRGVIFESKSGRQAILAKVVIDATGDGDIFAAAGAPFEQDQKEGDIHSTMNVAFRWGGVDYERFSHLCYDQPEEFEALMVRCKAETGYRWRPHIMPRKNTILSMNPKLPGYSCINVEDLTTVEIESRRIMLRMLTFYRANVPGFEEAWILDTAPQVGVRHSRRLVGVKKVTHADWTTGVRHEDEIGVCPPPTPKYPNVSLPLGSLVPAGLDNLLVAGRNFSCDTSAHVFLRLVPGCWLMGQAAGVAAAQAVQSGVAVRDIKVQDVQRHLLRQGAYLDVTIT